MMRRFFLALLVFSLLTSLTGTPSVNSAAGTWYVSPTGNDSATCSTAESPCATIAAAMVKPSFTSGDTIRVAAGTYTGVNNPLLLLDQSVTLSGGWNASFTAQSKRSVLDGENQRLVIEVDPNIIVSIDHFVIRRWYNGPYAWNSAIDNNGDLTVTHTQFVENGSAYAILNNATYGASLTLDQVAIENNNGGDW